MVKQHRNLQEVKNGLKEVNSSATGTDRFMAQCFPYLIELLESIDSRLKRRKKPLPRR